MKLNYRFQIINPVKMYQYFEKFLDVSLWIGAFIFALTTSFVSPLMPFLIITFALVACDTYSGIRAARARGEAIVSNGLRRTIEKMVLYFIAILLAEGMVQVFKIPQIPFTDFSITYVVAFAIAIIEFKSNIENVESVTGAKIWTYISEQVKSILPKQK